MKLKRKYLTIIIINISITIQEFNKLTSENFEAWLAQANLATKADIDDFVKQTHFNDKLKNLNKKVTSNKTKHVLVENELDKLSGKFKLIPTKWEKLIVFYKILTRVKFHERFS